MTIKSQSAKTSAQKRIHVNSDNVRYSNDSIFSLFSYHHNHVTEKSEQIEIEPKIANFVIRTKRKVPRTGLMLVGLGGNNGSTVAAGIIANRRNLSWKSRRGVHNANYLGSLTQSATLKMGDANGREKYFPFKRVLPLLNPDDLVVSGWDISGADLKTAMERAQVLPLGLQNRLSEEMAGIKPLPSVYYPDFIAANQNERADNLLEGSRASLLHLEKIRRDIRLFKEKEKLEKVIVLWTANTERFCEVTEGVHDTEQSFMKALKEGHSEISPSQVFAMAAVLENCSYINGSPQNTFVPAIRKAAKTRKVFLSGDDLKTGQTKIKSVLVDFLVSSGIRPESIVSYNHLGNNDGFNLSAPRCFSSKQKSKTNVIDDILQSNQILYPSLHGNNANDAKQNIEDTSNNNVLVKTDRGNRKRKRSDLEKSAIKPKNMTEQEDRKSPVTMANDKKVKRDKPDHEVVIKYVPFIGDSKRAMDEYTSSIFLDGLNTIVLHNTCEDSLLASPIIIDLVVLTELFERISILPLSDGDKDKTMVDHSGLSNGSDLGKDSQTVKELLRKCGVKYGLEMGGRFVKMRSELSVLSYLMKAPRVPEDSPVVNALSRQRQCIENVFRACLGLQPESHILLEHKIETAQ